MDLDEAFISGWKMIENLIEKMRSLSEKVSRFVACFGVETNVMCLIS